ncbi:MAG TPA: methyltransferase domain-containing protein [Candidatus Binataceae bacterium]|nr:methyltransferase domain-containing protein [Candidatus Binataceae bacterium]
MAEQGQNLDQLRLEQREYWSNAAESWKELWATRERANQPIADRLVQLAQIKPGDRVLDIATGLGEPAVTAARLVGPGGLVVATDQAPGMIAGARERAASLGMSNMEFVETDAETLAVGPRQFNAVVCRMGMMFVPNLERAARRIAELLLPGGRFATAVWSVPEKVPMISVGLEVARGVLGTPPRDPNAPHPLRLGNPQPLLEALRAAGFKDVTVEPITISNEWPNAQVCAEHLSKSGPLRALLSSQTPDSVSKVISAIRAALGKFADSTGTIRMVNEAWCICGHI